MKLVSITCDSCNKQLQNESLYITISYMVKDENHFCNTICLTRYLGPAAIIRAGLVDENKRLIQ